MKIPATTMDPILPELSRTRDLKFGFAETLKFFRDIGDDFLRRRALVYTYIPSQKNSRTFDNGPIIVDEDELARMQRAESGKIQSNKLMVFFFFLL